MNELERLFYLDEQVWPRVTLPPSWQYEWWVQLVQSQLAEIEAAPNEEAMINEWADVFLVALHWLRSVHNDWPLAVEARLRNHAYKGRKHIEEKYRNVG